MSRKYQEKVEKESHRDLYIFWWSKSFQSDHMSETHIDLTFSLKMTSHAVTWRTLLLLLRPCHYLDTRSWNDPVIDDDDVRQLTDATRKWRRVEDQIAEKRIQCPKVTHATALTLEQRDTRAPRATYEVSRIASKCDKDFGPSTTGKDDYWLTTKDDGSANRQRIKKYEWRRKKSDLDVKQHGIRVCTLSHKTACREKNYEHDFQRPDTKYQTEKRWSKERITALIVER